MDRFFLIGAQSVSVRSLIARELVSNILAHREYSIPAMSRVIIEKDRIVAENPNRSQTFGKLEPGNFTPRSKNPTIARFFVNIGYADELGSGMRNLYNFTDIYTNGAKPELVEGDTFKTTIPLLASETVTMVNPLNQLANSLRESLGPLTNQLNSFKDSLGPLVPPHMDSLNQLRESIGPLTNQLNSFKDSLGPLTNQFNSVKDSLGPLVSPLTIPLDTHKGQLNSPIIPFDSPKDQSEPIENGLNSLLDTLAPRTKLLKDELTKVERVFLDALLPYFFKNEWINAARVKECLGISQNSPATVRRRMKRLVDIGILERQGTTKNRKYRLVGSKNNSPSLFTAK
jgi:predicted HTH transcriptional regulator